MPLTQNELDFIIMGLIIADQMICFVSLTYTPHVYINS